MSARGFSLPEVLVVLAIIGILSSLLVANLLSARQVAEDRLALAHAHNVLKAA